MTTTPARPASVARFVSCHSVLHLDARHPLARQAVLDPHIMHRTVMSGFHGWTEPNSSDARAQMGVLNVWDIDLRADRLVLVVQSRVQPDWSAVPSAALAEDIVTLPVDLSVRAGDTFTFRTVLNPARDRQSWQNTPEGPRFVTRRLADTTPAHARTWFAERLDPTPGTPTSTPRRPTVRRIGAQGDASAMAVRILPKLTFHNRHRGAKVGRADIRGTLKVTDPTTFVTTLTEGLGRARAYGCGLLLIREAGP
ncbi:type I-E CRISPR-associated protein Cas6/Cse3/CasE [Streptomyces sp. NPDC057617]|uniref:type I-E CRISPR-associated protein Cas6/Cse3/CasE n=1 Tax=Streptomyces sp. NPDC057617 TaxID=3346184 RepID=UPI0036B377C7